MSSPRNLAVLVLAIIAGVLLLVSGGPGPSGLYQIVLQKLPSFIDNPLVLSAASVIELILIGISTFGGFVVILGGYLIYRRHVTSGKLVVGIGAGAGIPWLLFIAFTLIVTQEPAPIIASHSAFGWAGIILSLILRFVAK